MSKFLFSIADQIRKQYGTSNLRSRGTIKTASARRICRHLKEGESLGTWRLEEDS
jgi:hypothetical protein